MIIWLSGEQAEILRWLIDIELKHIKKNKAAAIPAYNFEMEKKLKQLRAKL